MDTNWGLTGHEWAVSLLRRHAANGEARHAYLFAGPNGVGRRTLAVRFAQALNCTNPPAPGEFCGICADCKKISVLRHPDLAIIEPIIKDGSLKVEQVRDAQRLLSMKPFMARFRISLFPDFQAATISAQNAMLKTLEEAPAYAILLLIANDPEQLLSTIVSRCEVLRLRTPGIQGVEKMLQDEGVDPVKARFLAHVGEGRPGLSKNMLAEDNLVHTRAQRLDELMTLLGNTRVQRFAYADMLTKAKCQEKHVEERIPLTREEERELERVKSKCVIRNTFPVWLSFWRDVLLRTSGAAVPITNIDYEDQINALAGRMDFAAARRVVADLELGIKRLEANVNTRLLTEVLLLDWPRI